MPTTDDLVNDQMTSRLKTEQQLKVNIASGLFTGAFCSGLFNPWDRALYLSVKNKIPFLSKENFKSPYQGFLQAVVQRAFLGSIYYIMQEELNCRMYPYLRKNLSVSETTTQCCIGMSAGSISGILTNSISAIKYHGWGQEGRKFIASTYDMWSKGGVKPFIKGTATTAYRDMTFGIFYEVTRSKLRTELSSYNNKPNEFNVDFISNSAAAAIATIAAGPFNYVRNIQYATSPSEKSPKILEILKNVWDESRKLPNSYQRGIFFQHRFCVGWGTARVAIGMATGQKVFDYTRTKLSAASSI